MYIKGGAAIAARRFCRGLIGLNQDAVMIVGNHFNSFIMK